MGELEGRTCCAVCFLSMPSLCVVFGVYSSQPEEAASFHYLVCLMPWRCHSFSLLAGTDMIFLIISESLNLYDSSWMTNVFGMCSLGSTELSKAGFSGKCTPQSFSVSAGCLLKCLRGSALFILVCVNLTALSWNGNLKPTTYIFCSLLYKKIIWSCEMLADELAWERVVRAYLVLWVPWPDGSCDVRWGMDAWHLYQVTERSSSVLIALFIHRINLWRGTTQLI